MIEDQTAIRFQIESEIEVVQSPVGVAEAGLFAALLQQWVGAAREFIRDQALNQKCNLVNRFDPSRSSA